MANKKADAAATAAAKAKKQKIILVAAGVVLLAIAVIQVPKLMKGGTTAVAAPVAGPPVTETDAAKLAHTERTARAVAVTRSGSSAVLAGVSIRSGGTSTLDAGQLTSFSLFQAKDPFIPQASDEPAEPVSPASTQPEAAAEQAGGASAGGNSSTSASSPSDPPEKPAVMTSATVLLDGKAYYLSLKDTFPQPDPLFVLASLKSNSARIGVAGGAFAEGKTLLVKKGKKVTLVNEATGARYTLKLVYAGATPEQTESFAQAEK